MSDARATSSPRTSTPYDAASRPLRRRRPRRRESHAGRVTKFFPASDVRLLAGLGVTRRRGEPAPGGEAKAAECADLDLRVALHRRPAEQQGRGRGGVRRRRRVGRPRQLVGPLDRGAHGAAARSTCCSRSASTRPGGSGRSGADPDDLADAGGRASRGRLLRLRGLMAVAPLGEDPATAFARLAEIRGDVRRHHPDATWLSAGMSGDLEAAVEAGATHVRVGTAVLGPRPPVK